MPLQRIIIVGTTGSGKTTLGRDLSLKLRIPAIDLDEIHWLPEWQTRDLEESRRMVDTATQQPAWVISGNYRKIQDVFWPRGDTMIWLDYPFCVVFWRLLRRSIGRCVDHREICNGNFETWRKFFSKDSIMVWLFQSFQKRKRECSNIFSHPEQYPHLTLIRFKTPRDTTEWLKGLPS